MAKMSNQDHERIAPLVLALSQGLEDLPMDKFYANCKAQSTTRRARAAVTALKRDLSGMAIAAGGGNYDACKDEAEKLIADHVGKPPAELVDWMLDDVGAKIADAITGRVPARILNAWSRVDDRLRAAMVALENQADLRVQFRRAAG